MAKPTTARIDPASLRHAEWLRVFGTDTVPLASPRLHLGTAPPPAGTALFYKLDVRGLTPEQRTRLVAHVADRFALPQAEVDAALDDPRHGVPILADDVRVDDPRWTPENRPVVDGSKPASGASAPSTRVLPHRSHGAQERRGRRR